MRSVLARTRQRAAAGTAPKNMSESLHSRSKISCPRAVSPEVQPAALDVPITRRRLVARHKGASFREVAHVVEEELPSLKDGEVLVRITHVGINGGCETFRARAEHMFSKLEGEEGFPLGAEAAGIIIAVASDVDLCVGQHVACNSASFSEYAVLPAAKCQPVEEANAQAVAVVLSGVFGCVAIEAAGNVQQGDNVLITAGAGAAGSFAIQFAKLAGAHVVTTVGSAAKAEVAKQLGADVVVMYREVEVEDALRSACPSGYDVVMDGVGGSLQEKIFRCLAPNCKVLLTGYISEYPHTTSNGSDGSSPRERPSNAEVFWSGLTVDLGEGRTLTGQIWPKDIGEIVRCKQKTFDLYQAGQIQAIVDSEMFRGLEQVSDAVDYMLSGKAIGKVVVEL